MSKDSFVLYADMYEAIKCLDDEQAGKLIKAIFEYNINKTMPKEKDILIAFMFIKSKLDKDTEKYEAVCERNRLNGQNGGRPKKAEKPNGLFGNPKYPKKADNDNDNDNEYDNDLLKKEIKENIIKEKKEKKENNKVVLGGYKLQVDNLAITESLKNSIKEWLDYKYERKEYYKDTGFKTLIKKILDYSNKYGNNSVQQLIENSMVNGYKGIIWDKIKKEEPDPYAGYIRLD